METTKEEYEERLSDWLKALRSGEFEQGVLALHTFDNDQHLFCCLGVACETAKIKLIKGETHNNKLTYDGAYGVLPKSVIDYYGIKNECGSFDTVFATKIRTSIRGIKDMHFTNLIGMNDALVPFDVIADAIEARKSEIFNWV